MSLQMNHLARIASSAQLILDCRPDQPKLPNLRSCPIGPILPLPDNDALLPDAISSELSSDIVQLLTRRVADKLKGDRERALIAYSSLISGLVSVEMSGGMADLEVQTTVSRYWERTFSQHCQSVIRTLAVTAARFLDQQHAVTRRQSGFSSSTLDILESAYERSHNLNPLEIKVVADAAGIKPQQVRTWFQNKRNRKRKTEPKPRVTSTSALSTSTAAFTAAPAPTLSKYVDDAHESAIPHLADTLYPINTLGSDVAFERVIRTLPTRRSPATNSSQHAQPVVPEIRVHSATSNVSSGSDDEKSESPSLSPEQPLDGQHGSAYTPSYTPGERYMTMDMYTGDLPLPSTLCPLPVDAHANADINMDNGLGVHAGYDGADYAALEGTFIASDVAAEWQYIAYSSPSVRPLEDLVNAEADGIFTEHCFANDIAQPAQHRYDRTSPELYQLFPNTRYSDTNSMVTDFATMTTDPGVPVYSLSSFASSSSEPTSPEERGRSVSSLPSLSAALTLAPDGLLTPMGMGEDDPFLGMFGDTSPVPTTDTSSDLGASANATTYFTVPSQTYEPSSAQMDIWTREQHDEIQDWIFDILPFDQTPAGSFYAPPVVSA